MGEVLQPSEEEYLPRPIKRLDLFFIILLFYFILLKEVYEPIIKSDYLEKNFFCQHRDLFACSKIDHEAHP